MSEEQQRSVCPNIRKQSQKPDHATAVVRNQESKTGHAVRMGGAYSLSSVNHSDTGNFRHLRAVVCAEQSGEHFPLNVLSCPVTQHCLAFSVTLIFTLSPITKC